jgi:hypothetical protein
VLGLVTRASALQALGRTRESIDCLRSAVTLARPMGDAPLFLRSAVSLLQLYGHDALAAEAAATTRCIASALPDLRMRTCFETALPRTLFATSSPPGHR